MTKRQHPCTKRKSHKTYSVTKTKIESTLIITFFCGVKTKFCLAKQQKSKSCHLCHGCGATIYKAYFSGFNAIVQKWFFSRHPNPKSICPKSFGYLYYKVRCVFVCPSTLKCTNVTSPQVLKLWNSQGKYFITSKEFDKNISDWRYDCTDHKNAFDFFMWLVKWP